MYKCLVDTLFTHLFSDDLYIMDDKNPSPPCSFAIEMMASTVVKKNEEISLSDIMNEAEIFTIIWCHVRRKQGD